VQTKYYQTEGVQMGDLDTEMSLYERRYGSEDWIYLAQDRV
jgi:hypothetical protein